MVVLLSPPLSFPALLLSGAPTELLLGESGLALLGACADTAQVPSSPSFPALHRKGVSFQPLGAAGRTISLTTLPASLFFAEWAERLAPGL